MSASTDAVCSTFIFPPCVGVEDDGDACGDAGSGNIAAIDVLLEVCGRVNFGFFQNGRVLLRLPPKQYKYSSDDGT